MRQKDHWLYARWVEMKQRCHNKNHKSYSNYGGRGIGVCEEWRKDFWAYAEHMDSLEGYQDGFTVDRINNDGDYSPGNLRWSSRRTQVLNRRRWGKGYSYHKRNKKWMVKFKILGKHTYFGYYKTESEAKKVADFALALAINSVY